ncbi:bifunctional DNA-formamidopyrimidine glycosylase/DNA-(apurinic or apyrimidinic site) lyase [Arthrobacter zhaoguopingii]|uniref:bifunctional DNA-formamidopyrimidine glycosylase/DNA-(apurinic or apyrimidinic site) lyase n=1 Tax=Arthrobacter zhaoguopingii TaxID=2681491 RepID=UPI0013585052|nr:bifunctional DNA-formamidopyrimidine glycosylase/DNA-(apurinic or apyrimidinic site) lyase [Arthrobacter zhaoguopingii]
MPELPEVEVVRRGLARWAGGRTIEAADVLDPRSARRHPMGPDDLQRRLAGMTIADVVRRGKFLWMPLNAPSENSHPAGPPRTALMAHLGMSGQLLVKDPGLPDEKHLRIRLVLSPARDETGVELPSELRFVDQRIFGGMFLADLEPTPDGLPGGRGEGDLPLIPRQAAHIARDPLDPAFSFDVFHARLRARRTGIKRALLDQSLISGIGNIYADEALWAARLHFARPTDTLRRSESLRLVEEARSVMERALEAGGTSFDSLYVNINGTSGYFERSLNAYGRTGEHCRRCAAEGRETRMRRDVFMNRSSYSCPRCQPVPRNARW